MFNALLGSFVAWSLTAGALPGPWPAAASLALGGALLLLHGHTHGAVIQLEGHVFFLTSSQAASDCHACQ